jgi:hypothetical protein
MDRDYDHPEWSEQEETEDVEASEQDEEEWYWSEVYKRVFEGR